MRIGLGKIVVSVLSGFREILGFVFPQNRIGCDVEIREARISSARTVKRT